MPIDMFKNAMGRTGVADSKEANDALLELIRKVEDLEKDHDETKDIVVTLNRDLNNALPPGE